MICNRCGTFNQDGSYSCANCGAPLGNYQQPPGYGSIQQQKGPKPMVLYFIAGAVAALLIIFILLPQFSYHYDIKVEKFNKVYNVFGVKSFVNDASKYSSSNSKDVKAAGDVLAGAAIGLFIPPVCLCVVWAVLSFLRKKAAGILGIIASAYYAFMALIWIAMIAALSSASKSGKYVDKVDMTAVPVFMLLLAIAGIPIGIFQIVKRKNL